MSLILVILHTTLPILANANLQPRLRLTLLHGAGQVVPDQCAHAADANCLVTGKPLLFNRCRASTTTTDEEDHEEKDDRASQNDTIFSGEEQRLFPIPTPLKPRLRHSPLKPFTLDVREDKYEKVADEDVGPVLSTHSSRCSANSASRFSKDRVQDSLILHQESASANAPSQQLPPNLPPSPCPPLLALASSGAAESGPLPVTKLPFPSPVPSVSSPRPPK
ncbi:hypothetical protein DL96DRAFT_1824786 [Flagelloscypha sp. PMI_526]|nr:hypothetical protein DL96DRAFT_1824786 [Flagelloscypha sp. PMI_526]